MKKKVLIFISIVFVLTMQLDAQTYLISGGNKTTCSGTLYDSGGSGSNYSNSEDFTMTITPSTAGNMLRLVFSSFDTESISFDWLEIYDGTTTAAPLLGKWGGTTGPGTVTASNGTGALTLVWHSDGSVTHPGFAASISCIPPSPMTFVSATTTQTNTTQVSPLDVNRQILGFEIVTTNTLSPLVATDFNIRTDGSSNPPIDIQNVKIWYTGTSSTFATTTQFGPTMAAAPGLGVTATISGTQTLSSGTNYFWLTYDIQAGAGAGGVVDGCGISTVISGTGHALSPNCPAGSRPINVPPANDDPCTAQVLTVNAGSCAYTTGNNSYATASTGMLAPGCSNYSGGDVWYQATVPASGRLIVDMGTSGGPTDMGMAWYTSPTNNCNNLTLLECDDDDSQNGAMPMICRTGMLCTVPGDCAQNATLTPGQTIWIRVFEYGNNSFGPFDICAYEPDPPGPPSNCGTPTNIASLPYLASGLTTCCKGDDYDPTDGCASSYQDGEDYIFTYTPAANIIVDVTISGTSSYTGVFVTDKCPSNATANCIAQNTNSSGNPVICGVSLNAGTTYYIMVDTDPGPNCTSFGITVRESMAVTCGLNYSVSSIAYSADPTTGTAISLPIDDRFSATYIPIGFPFCFDGIQYTQLLVSSNGYLIFDPIGCATNLPTTNAAPNGYSGYTISAAVPNTTNAPRNAIMFPWQDIDPSVGGNLRYKVYGTAPNRRFVVTVNSVPMYGSSCTGYEYRGQVKLFETTNNIEVHMLRKDLCTGWNSGRAILGLHNYNGTIAVTAYNYPTQWSANNEAWRFTCNCVGCIVLPIELLSFEGEQISSFENKLNWETASELNNNYFEVERKDASSGEFVNIGEIDGAGFSNVVKSYEFIDDQVSSNVNYYRLKQVDYDGKYSYTKTIVIGNTIEEVNSIYPNPATDVLNLNINVYAEYVTVYIVNAIGDVVYEEQMDALNSIKAIVDISQFAAGNYHVLVRDDKSNVVLQEKLIIE